MFFFQKNAKSKTRSPHFLIIAGILYFISSNQNSVPSASKLRKQFFTQLIRPKKFKHSGAGWSWYFCRGIYSILPEGLVILQQQQQLMNTEQSLYYHNLSSDLYTIGTYYELCCYYNYCGIHIQGHVIHLAIAETETMEEAKEYLEEIIFEDNEPVQVKGGALMRPEYFGLPLANLNEDDE